MINIGKKIVVDIPIKENIIEDENGIKLLCSKELEDDVKAMYGIDLQNKQLLNAVKKFNAITIR